MERRERIGDPAVLARFHLDRLERFTRLAAESDVLTTGAHGAELRRWRRLAHHAAFSAYRDSVAIGLEQSAHRVLERAPSQRSPAG